MSDEILTRLESIENSLKQTDRGRPVSQFLKILYLQAHSQAPHSLLQAFGEKAFLQAAGLEGLSFAGAGKDNKDNSVTRYENRFILFLIVRKELHVWLCTDIIY
jgi:hypothetical protein